MVNAVRSGQIRNVAIVGHGGAGKTTLCEALLAMTGAIARKGRVEDGTTVSDFEPEETKHHVSISTSVIPIFFNEFKINLLDTPGYVDFFPEVELALNIADLAVIVVSGIDGVAVQTRAVWRLAERLGLPRLIFVNKLDKEHADFERVLDQLREVFGSGIAPLELPLGKEQEFCGVVDLFSDTAITYVEGHPTTGPIPDNIAPQEHRVRDNLVEDIVVADDNLTERYLDGDALSPRELESTLAKGVKVSTVFPVICGSADRSIGLDRLCTLITEITPARHVLAHAGNEVVDIPSDPKAEPLARVVKTMSDPFVGKLSLLQVLSGTLRPDIVLTNTRAHEEERLHVLNMLRGKEASLVPEASAGDLVAVAKLASARVGDTLAPRSSPVVVDTLTFSAPVLYQAIRPKTTGDEDRLMSALYRLEEEDLSLRVRRDNETHQTVVAGMGETHLQIVHERLRRKFNVEIEDEEFLVPYRETISANAESEGRHKKQTGGRGQFAVVHLRAEPLARGSGFEFVDNIVGGTIPRQFIPAVEKGIVRAMRQGGIFGYPVVDVRVTCDNGKFHAVDSSETSFELAGALAFSLVLERAGSTPLEPVDRVEVTVPVEYQGDVLGDLNSRRGRVLASETVDFEQVITALVPQSELTRYAIELRALSGGQGKFSTCFDHYEELSPQLASKLPRKHAVAI